MRFVFKPFGDVLADDPLRQSFDDRGLADTGLADQDRVVLGAARQHLDDAPDLLVTADDRIEFALAGEFGQIAAIALERFIRRLRVLRRDALRTADGGERLQDRVRRNLLLLQQAGGGGGSALGRNRDEQVFGADVFVLQPLGF